MSEPQSHYHCPACDRAILNRKIDKCLFCGAGLPAELLLSKEAIDNLDRQQQQCEQRSTQTTSQPASDGASSNWSMSDIVDTIDVIDVAADVISGISDLLD